MPLRVGQVGYYNVPNECRRRTNSRHLACIVRIAVHNKPLQANDCTFSTIRKFYIQRHNVQKEFSSSSPCRANRLHPATVHAVDCQIRISENGAVWGVSFYLPVAVNTVRVCTHPATYNGDEGRRR